MKLLKLKQDPDARLLEKVLEEANELADAIMQGEDKRRVLSEGIDVIQATFSLLNKIATQEEIEKASVEHVRKLRVRGCEIEKEYKIMEVRG